MMKARPFYFGPHTEALFGWYHPPQGHAREAAVVICPPLGVEAIFSHRALRHLAERLALDGFPVLRYDHHGTGDSAGLGTEPARVPTWLAGVRMALDTARERSGVTRLALIGLRLGATFAAATAAEGGGVDSMVFWAPVTSGRRYARELGAFSQMGGAPGGGGVGGFYVASETLEAVADLDLTRLTQTPAPRALIVPRDDIPDDGALAAALTALGASVQTSAVPGYAAAVTEPHNTQVPAQVIDSISAWLTAAHPVSAGHVRRPSTRGRESLFTSEISSGRGRPVEVRERTLFLDDDQRLAGIFTEPTGRMRRKTAIVLINAGAVGRVGPNRLYVAMARQWAALGFRVLRMDLGGIGDSGAAPGVPENDTYPPTAVPDLVTALEALRREGETEFVVAGLCSGAHAVFHFGLERADIPGVMGLVLINPIVFYWKPGDALDVSAWQTYTDHRHYKMQVKNPRAWLRVLQGRVNVFAAAQTLARRGMTVATAAVARMRSRRNPGLQTDDLARDLTSLAARPLCVLMVFSEGDPGLDQLQLHASHVLGPLTKRDNFTMEIVPDADHTFTQLSAQSELLSLLADQMAGTYR